MSKTLYTQMFVVVINYVSVVHVLVLSGRHDAYWRLRKTCRTKDTQHVSVLLFSFEHFGFSLYE
jgi:uncharacterized protein with PQ loop repeat